MSVSTMPITHRGGGWWIDDAGEDTGPYDTRREAQEARRGLRRFYRYQNQPGFVTSETRGKKA